MFSIPYLIVCGKPKYLSSVTNPQQQIDTLLEPNEIPGVCFDFTSVLIGKNPASGQKSIQFVSNN